MGASLTVGMATPQCHHSDSTLEDIDTWLFGVQHSIHIIQAAIPNVPDMIAVDILFNREFSVRWCFVGAAAINGKPLQRVEVHGKNLFYFFGNEGANPIVLHGGPLSHHQSFVRVVLDVGACAM